jgi:hypothetical protein
VSVAIEDGFAELDADVRHEAELARACLRDVGPTAYQVTGRFCELADASHPVETR